MLLKLLQNELSKAARTKLPYFGLVVVLLICVLTHIGADQLNSSDTGNGWGFVSLSMQLAFTDIGLIVIVIFSSLLMAEETSSGTLQAVLVSPVYRWEVYVAKMTTGLLYVAFLSLAALLVSVILARLRYKFGAVGDAMGIVYSSRQVALNLGLAVVASWVPLGALVLCALLFSTLIRRPGAAIAASLGIVYVVDFTKHLIGIDPYVFTRYITKPWQVFQQIAGGIDVQWQPDIWNMLGLCGIYGVTALVAGIWIFHKQDLH